MKFSRMAVLIAVVFFIYPFISLPLIIKEIYEKKYYALNYLALFMGLLAYLWIPSGDLYRYYEDFNVLNMLSFSDLWSVLTFDFVLQSVMFIIAKIGLNFEFVRFLLCTISYCLYFSIFKSVISKSTFATSKSNCIKIFFLFFFLLRFSAFLTGVRFTFAMALCFYGVYQILYNNSIRGYFFLLLSCFTHFSFWIVLLMTLVVKFLKPSLSRKKVLFLLILLFISSSVFISSLIHLLPLNDLLVEHLENYTTGYYAGMELANQSLKFRLVQIFSIVAIYPATILLFIRAKSLKDFQLFILFLFLLTLLWNMNTAFNRYAFLAVIFFIIPFSENKLNYFLKRDLNLMLYIGVLVYFSSIYSVKRELSFGHQISIIYSPLPLLLSNTYTDLWVQQNILPNGNMRYNNN